MIGEDGGRVDEWLELPNGKDASTGLRNVRLCLLFCKDRLGIDAGKSSPEEAV